MADPIIPPEVPVPAPSPAPPPAPPAPPAAELPPAGRTVLEGPRTEREVNLEKELAEERSARRKAETDAAYAQDEARRLKDVQTTAPRPAKAKRVRWTLFHDPEA